MSRLGEIGGRLYRGEVSFDFIGKKRDLLPDLGRPRS